MERMAMNGTLIKDSLLREQIKAGNIPDVEAQKGYGPSWGVTTESLVAIKRGDVKGVQAIPHRSEGFSWWEIAPK